MEEKEVEDSETSSDEYYEQEQMTFLLNDVLKVFLFGVMSMNLEEPPAHIKERLAGEGLEGQNTPSFHNWMHISRFLKR